jgi:Sulfotransferase family
MTRHLLHIGFPKAGSTFLQRWFDGHPQLAHTYGGIGGFRDMHAIAREGTTRREVLYRVTSNEEFSAPRADAGRMEIDYEHPRELTMALSQERVCSMLSALFPNATILIITRGFRSMILSSLSQYARSGGEADLAGMLRGPHKYPDDPWHYDDLIGLYRHAFGQENVVVMPYELLRDDADAFTRTLSASLGIDPHPPLRERVNESLSPIEMYWYPRLTRLARRIPSRRLFDRYILAALRNELRGPIAWLNRLKPGTPFTSELISEEAVNTFRGRANSLRGNPLYAPYAAEYLH